MPKDVGEARRVSIVDFIRDPATLEGEDPSDIAAARDFLNKQYPAGRPSTTTTTTLPPKKERMTAKEREETLAKLEKARAELESLRKNPSAPSGAFVGQGVETTGEMPEALPSGGGTLQSAAEFAIPSAVSMAGASAGARAVAPIAEGIPHPLGKLAVEAAGAAGGAMLGGGVGQGTMEAAKAALGLPGAPDSVADAVNTMYSRGLEEGKGELLGRTVLGPVASKILPYAKALTPNSEAMMTDHARRIRAAYAQIGGADLVEDTRMRFNPMRILRPIETELDDEAVVQRLIANGYDPAAARKVALTGGLAPSEVENSTFSKLWGQISSTQMQPHTVLDLKYNVARSKLAQVAGLEDIGAKFADSLPPEQVGEAVSMALHGRFDVLNGARVTATNTIANELPDGFMINVAAAKRFRSKTGQFLRVGEVPDPASIAPMTLIQGLDDKSSFQDIQAVRTSLSTMMHDQRLDEVSRREAERAARYLDGTTKKGLPSGLRDSYGLWSHADDDMNREAFNTEFIKGLLKNKAGLKAFAENKLIKPGDVGLFRSLEDSLSNVPDGEKLIANVKGAIGDRLLEGAMTPEGVIQPNRLIMNIATQSKGYGKYFLNAVMGPDYVRGYQQYAEVMNQVNHAAQRASSRLGAVKTFVGATAAASGLSALAQGVLGESEILKLTAAMYAPKATAAILTSKQATRWLLKAAHNIATGTNPRTASRLAGRALEYVGITPEAALEGMGILPSERQDQMMKEVGAFRSDPTMSAQGAL